MRKPGRPKGSTKANKLDRWCSVSIGPDLDARLRKGSCRCGMSFSAAARLLMEEGLEPGKGNKIIIALREAAST